MKLIQACTIAILALASCVTSHAESTVPTADPLAPALVAIVGIHVNKVQEINFKDGKVTLDFHLWVKWREPPVAQGAKASFEPLSSLEMMNGKMEAVGSRVEWALKDGTHYASQRYVATVYKVWDISRFPFDKHVIDLQFEDSGMTRKALLLVPSKGSRLGNEIEIAGWTVPELTASEATHLYDTDFGEGLGRGLHGSAYSRSTFHLKVERRGPGPAIKLLTIVSLATLVGFVAFGIKPQDVDPRFGLGVGAMFAVVANAFSLAQTVPDSDVLTTADKIHMVAIAFIFMSIVTSAVCLRWAESGRIGLQQRVDNWCLALFPLAYLLVIGILVWQASHA